MRGGRNATVNDEQLIVLVKEHPLLYDPEDSRYTDAKARDEVWTHIGTTLSKSPSLCKSRWTNLRDNYRKYLRKRLTNARVTNRYDDMLGTFLKPCIKLSLADENGDINPFDLCNVETKDEMGDDENVNFGALNDTYQQQIEGEPPNPFKRRYSQSFYQQYPQGFEMCDPIDAFLAGIGSTIKTFNPVHQNMIKTKLFNLVQEFELEFVLNEDKEKETHETDIT